MADFGRLSVHGVGMLGAAPAEYDAYWQTLGLGRVSLVRVFSGTLAPDVPVHVSGHFSSFGTDGHEDHDEDPQPDHA